MPEQNRNKNRRPQPERNETLIIPHVTKEMVEKARAMAEAGATRAEIEAAMLQMQGQQPPKPEPETLPAPEKTTLFGAVRSPKPPKAPPAPKLTAPKPAAEPAPERRAPRTRAEAEQQLAEKIRSDHLWLSNPMMVRGLGLAPAICAALDVQRALMLCVAGLILVTLTRVVAVAICHLTQNRGKMFAYLYAAALLYIPTYVLMTALFGPDLNLLGIYLPILVVEPAVIKRVEFDELESVQDAARHGLNNALGLCLALLLVGGLRELLAAGTLYGYPVLQVALLPLAAQPAGGFVIVGLLAAVWMATVNLYTQYKNEEVSRLYADRKR